MEKVFHIPELIRVICANAEPADIAHLALTCQNLFMQAIPVAWAHVSGISQLLALIGGDESLDTIKNLKMNLPNNVGSISQSRFGFYAPFVTSLEIYKSKYQDLSLIRHERLTHSAFPRVPLPNLVRLSISSAQTSADNHLWIDIFSCPSLLEVYIPWDDYSRYPYHSPAVASRITRTLHHNCPNLQRLELFWDAEEIPSLFDDDDLPQSPGNLSHESEDLMDKLLPSFLSLTTFIGRDSLLEPSMLLALGDLPRLQHLEVHFSYYEDDFPIPNHPTLPPRSFPCLNRLALTYINESYATSIWNLSPLVARLCSVTVKLFPSDDSQDRSTCQSFIPLLCTQSPHISKLTLEFNPYGANLRTPYIEHFTKCAFNALARLKLTQLELFHARLAEDIPVGLLINTWPDLEVLRMPDHHIVFLDLLLFAERLPKLKQLALDIQIKTNIEEDLIKCSTAPRWHQLHTLESRFHGVGRLDGDAASKLYWYMRNLIPNAKLEARRGYNFDLYPDQNLDATCVAALNATERFLQTIQGHFHPEDDEICRQQVSIFWDMVRLQTMQEVRPRTTQKLLESQPVQLLLSAWGWDESVWNRNEANARSLGWVEWGQNIGVSQEAAELVRAELGVGMSGHHSESR